MTRECPSCRADLSLLVDYAGSMQDGLARAESLTRQGELGEAVWTYLSILETDPDCPAARRQVGQVAAAVRQFDQITDGRRWYQRVRDSARFGGESGWVNAAIWVVLVLAALLVGYWLGRRATPSDTDGTPGASQSISRKDAKHAKEDAARMIVASSLRPLRLSAQRGSRRNCAFSELTDSQPRL